MNDEIEIIQCKIKEAENRACFSENDYGVFYSRGHYFCDQVSNLNRNRALEIVKGREKTNLNTRKNKRKSKGKLEGRS